MKTKSENSFTGIPKPAFPIQRFIKIPDGIAITPEALRISDLATIPRDLKLVTKVGYAKVFITRDETIRVRLIHTIEPDDTLAKQHGVKQVARAMDHATCLVPIDEEEANKLPRLKFSSWTRPNVISWEFELPITATGDQLVDAAEASELFIFRTAETLLTSPSPVE